MLCVSDFFGREMGLTKVSSPYWNIAVLLIPDTVCNQFFSLVVSDTAAVGVLSEAGM